MCDYESHSSTSIILWNFLHRAIKRLVNPGMGFGSFNTAKRTLRGYEAMNMIRKGQIQGVDKGDILGQVESVSKIFGVAA